MGAREQLAAAAARALDNPQHAPAVAREILGLIDQMPGNADVPSDYVYAGAHTWTARIRNLAVENLPEDTPAGSPIWSTTNEAVPIRVPFDALIQGVSGFALPQIEDESRIGATLGAAQAQDGRDLFAVSWDIDGQTSFVTDGRAPRLVPAACVVGTARNPRAMGWTIRRNQTINVRFRNLMNAIASTAAWEANELSVPLLAEASITFHVLNLGAP